MTTPLTTEQKHQRLREGAKDLVRRWLEDSKDSRPDEWDAGWEAGTMECAERLADLLTDPQTDEQATDYGAANTARSVTEKVEVSEPSAKPSPTSTPLRETPMSKTLEEIRDDADREMIASLYSVARHMRDRATKEDRYPISNARRARMRLEAADFERAAAAGEVCLADSIDRRTLASIPKGEIDA